MINQFARDAVVAAVAVVATAILTNFNTLWATFKSSKIKESEIAAKAQSDLIDDGAEIRKEYRQLWQDTQTHAERLEGIVGRLTLRNSQLEDFIRGKGLSIPPDGPSAPPGPAPIATDTKPIPPAP